MLKQMRISIAPAYEDLLTLVSQDEAKKIFDNGQRMIQSNNNGGRQLGNGVYAMSGFQEWNDEEDRFDCAITISATDWASTKKAWVPQRFKFPNTPQYVLLGTQPPRIR